MRLYEATSGVVGMSNQGINPSGLDRELVLDSPRPRLGRYWIVSRVVVEWAVSLSGGATEIDAAATLSHDNFPLASLSAGRAITIDNGDIWSPTEFFSAVLQAESFIRLTAEAHLQTGAPGSGGLFATLRLYGQNLKESA